MFSAFVKILNAYHLKKSVVRLMVFGHLLFALALKVIPDHKLSFSGWGNAVLLL